jgi:hypothetical protein
VAQPRRAAGRIVRPGGGAADNHQLVDRSHITNRQAAIVNQSKIANRQSSTNRKSEITNHQ